MGPAAPPSRGRWPVIFQQRRGLETRLSQGPTVTWPMAGNISVYEGTTFPEAASSIWRAAPQEVEGLEDDGKEAGSGASWSDGLPALCPGTLDLHTEAEGLGASSDEGSDGGCSDGGSDVSRDLSDYSDVSRDLSDYSDSSEGVVAPHAYARVCGRSYVDAARAHFDLLHTPMDEVDTEMRARAELDIASKFMTGGATGEAGETWVHDILKKYGSCADDIQSTHVVKRRLLKPVQGRLIPKIVELVGGGTFTWLIQDPLAVVARQLVDHELTSHPGFCLEAKHAVCGGDRVVDGYMSSQQAEDMEKQLRSEYAEEDGAGLRRLLIPIGIYLDGSHLDDRGNATALPLILLNEMCSDRLYSEIPTVAEVIGYIPCWDDILPSHRIAQWTSDDRVEMYHRFVDAATESLVESSEGARMLLAVPHTVLHQPVLAHVRVAVFPADTKEGNIHAAIFQNFHMTTRGCRVCLVSLAMSHIPGASGPLRSEHAGAYLQEARRLEADTAGAGVAYLKSFSAKLIDRGHIAMGTRVSGVALHGLTIGPDM